MSERLLYLTRADIEHINLPMKNIVEILSKLFKEKGEGKIEMPPKPGIHPKEDSSIRAMLAYIPSLDAAGVKWISGYGRNYIKGLPNINGLLILNNTETGLPKTIMDCSWITAKRTGAATAVAAKLLAKKDSSSLGVLACGLQGRVNLEALIGLYNLKTINAFDINKKSAKKFAKEMSKELNVKIEVVDEAKKAVENMDLIVTSGPILSNPDPVIQADWLKPGSFVCPLDFDSYVQPQAFEQADILVTDDIAQMTYFRKTGYFKETPEPHTDLGHIAAGFRPGRENDEQRTISINLGIGMHDIAVASAIYEKAIEENIGTMLPI